MNDVIKQFALECYSPYKDFDHEAFANLIIFECLKLAVFNGDIKTARAIEEKFRLNDER